jgi:hypothetical protein
VQCLLVTRPAAPVLDAAGQVPRVLQALVRQAAQGPAAEAGQLFARMTHVRGAWTG